MIFNYHHFKRFSHQYVVKDHAAIFESLSGSLRKIYMFVNSSLFTIMVFDTLKSGSLLKTQDLPSEISKPFHSFQYAFVRSE
jgi:hypothetical protein